MEPIEIRVTIWISQGGTISVRTASPQSDVCGMPAPVPTVDLKTFLGCHRWEVSRGKKPAQSCKGCTVTCPAKNKYKGEPMEIKS